MTTITDVARRAGVSPVTVSRVINDVPNVNLATRERVERAIAELGYVPNVVARSLRSRRTRSLALIVPDITNTFWTTVARGVTDAAQERGYTVLLCNTDESAARQDSYLELVASQRVDGVILAPCDSDASRLGILRDRTIPTVTIDRRIDGWEIDSVLGDSVGGAYALVKHLIALGHRRIAIISGPAATSTAEDRVAGYRLALADAGLPIDPRLIQRGEFRSASGEQLAEQLLDQPSRPTAIFAANNAIAMGVIDAMQHRSLRIPHDIALVCFDDLANASHLFPFLTVVVQPAYEMGLNAAQLLLSRLDAAVPLRPRHVVLPSRLIVRYSCGSKLKGNGSCDFSLPLAGIEEAPGILVRPLRPGQRDRSRAGAVDAPAVTASDGAFRSPYDPAVAGRHKPDISRLLAVLQHQEADRVPHLELEVASRAVYSYVLQREPKAEPGDIRSGHRMIAPEDQIEFSQRLGIDAVICAFSWLPRRLRPSPGGSSTARAPVTEWDDLNDLEPFPPLSEQLSRAERYLRAAQGTGVGVCAAFTSFFDAGLQAMRPGEPALLLQEHRKVAERLMDVLVEHQSQVVRAVCDRFADDLAFVLIRETITGPAGFRLAPEQLTEVLVPRMERLIEPAREHGKLLALQTAGPIGVALPMLHALGFGAILTVDPQYNDLAPLREQWRGKLAFGGNIPTSLLLTGSRETIEATVREHCTRLAPGGGYVIGSALGIPEGVPPENLVAMTQAVHAHGRYRHAR